MEQLNEFDIEEVCELEVDIEQVGPRGLSAYEVYLQTGGTLSEEEWLESLKGITPTIGANGNWFLGDTDTGLSSRGEKGETGGISHEEVKVVTGELENLSTEDKTSLVNAINELVSSGTSSNAILVHDNKISVTGNLISVSADARIEISKLLNKNIDKVVLICVYNSSKKISLYYLLKVDIPTKNATISHDIQGLVVYGTSLYSCNGIMFVGTDATTITGVGFGNIYINQYASKTDVDTTTGDLTTLMTVDKTSLVNAINEMVNNSSWITEITEDKAKLYEYPEGIYYTTKSVNVAVGYSTSEGKKLIIIGRKNDENTVMVFLKDGYYYSDYHNFAKYYGYNNLVLQSDVLTKTNQSSYKPSQDYNPATKLYVDTSTGDLTTLVTEEKSNLVGAINEVINNNIPNSAIVYDNDMNITQNSLTIGSDTRIKIKDIINKNLDNSVLICVHNSTFRINLYFMTYIPKPTNSITSQVNVFGLLTNYSEVYSWTARMNVGKNGTTGLVTSISFSNSTVKQYSTREYVDGLVGDIGTVLATLTTVSEVNE